MKHTHTLPTSLRSLSVLLSAGLIATASLGAIAGINDDSPTRATQPSHQQSKKGKSTPRQSSYRQTTKKSVTKTIKPKAHAQAKTHQSTPDEGLYTLGDEQSPVNIPAGMPVHDADIEFHYRPMALNIINNGHTVQVNADDESYIEVEDKKYTLLQFHFHALSEHTYQGEHYDMEVHFVHQSKDGEYAVVGIFLKDGKPSAAYAPVLSNLPLEKGDEQGVTGVAINTIDLMPSNHAYYRYDGSFTTPPYTEGVKWFVMAVPVELDSEQIAAFTTLYSDNYRIVQGINERKFIAGSSACDYCKARKMLASFADESLITE